MSTSNTIPRVQPVPRPCPTIPRQMAAALAPLTVACPLCGSPRGSQCRSTGGFVRELHHARLKAVRYLSERERVAAYTALRAEQDDTRSQVQARLAESRTDPDVAASRRATGEAWARICRETAGVR